MEGISIVPIDDFFYFVCSMSDFETFDVVNSEMAGHLGYEPDALAGAKVRQIFTGDEADQWIISTQEVFEKRKKVRCEQSVTNKAGQRCFLRIVKAPRFDSEGNINTVVCACEDVTEKKIAEELVKAQRDIAVAMLTGDLGHTLQKGIQSILGCTALDFGVSGFLLDDKETWVFPSLVGVSEMFAESLRNWLEGNETFKILLESEPVYTQFGELSIQKDAFRGTDGIKAVAMIPVIEGGRLIGIVTAGSHSTEVIPRKSRDIIEALAGQMGQAISRYRIVAALKESEEMYRALIETSPDPILVLDTNRTIIKASKRALDLLEREESEVTGKDAVSFVAPEYTAAASDDISLLIDREVLVNREYELLKKDGSRFMFNTSYSVIHDGEGNAKLIVITGKDMTDMKRAEEKLKRINAELQSYAHTVSHDLKGPVSNIILAGELVLQMLKRLPQSEVRDEIEQVLSTVAIHGNRAHDLIQNVLVLAEVGQEPYKLEKVDLLEKVKRIIREYAAEVEKRGIDIVIDKDLGSVNANLTQMYQLFSNLILNAMRHGASDGSIIEIRRVPSVRQGESRFLIRDNGPGIPEEVMNNLQEEYSITGKMKYGIGLSIADKIVKAYNGELRVYNDHGACFEFSLMDLELF
ncbi:MAG: PAS domain S-box protein [Actinobacteria bacterium]|nr:PAS domain S-box protein [Actinomycetota bacterium]